MGGSTVTLDPRVRAVVEAAEAVVEAWARRTDPSLAAVVGALTVALSDLREGDDDA
jgi:hypothetical protein